MLKGMLSFQGVWGFLLPAQYRVYKWAGGVRGISVRNQRAGRDLGVSCNGSDLTKHTLSVFMSPFSIVVLPA
jgi:hypothetical protein